LYIVIFYCVLYQKVINKKDIRICFILYNSPLGLACYIMNISDPQKQQFIIHNIQKLHTKCNDIEKNAEFY